MRIHPLFLLLDVAHGWWKTVSSPGFALSTQKIIDQDLQSAGIKMAEFGLWLPAEAKMRSILATDRAGLPQTKLGIGLWLLGLQMQYYWTVEGQPLLRSRTLIPVGKEWTSRIRVGTEN
jgi:hypothetical protein